MLRIATTLFLKSIVIFSGLLVSTVPVSPRFLPQSFLQTENNGKFALLIGIDKYENGIPALSGAVADALAMKDLLTGQKYGFPVGQVKLLPNEDATGENILSIFRSHLIANAMDYKAKTGKEATIFFHFSGHGSQAAPPDFMTKTDEPDGFDETIVPIDSGRNGQAKGFDIKDDEIFELVSELSKYTSNVVYVFDNCNSGTVTRGSAMARETEVDKRKQPAYRVRKTIDKIQKDKNYDDLLLGSDSFVMIAGSRSSRKSYEIEMPDGTRRGALSFYLERALRSASPRTTYAELMRRVSIEVNHHNSDQEPQISGDKTRFLLGGNLREGEIPIPVVLVDRKKKTITIGAGKMIGLREGSLIAVYNKKNERIAEGEVIEVDTNKAAAEYSLLGDRPINRNADTVKLLSPLFGSEPVRVILPLSEETKTRSSTSNVNTIFREVAKELAGDSKGLFRIEIPEPGQLKNTRTLGLNIPSINVMRAGFREAFCGGLRTDNARSIAETQARCSQLLPEAALAGDGKTLIPNPKDDDEVFYLAPTESGEPVFDFFVGPNDKQAPEKIATALRKYARQKNLLALSNTAGLIANDLKIEFIEVRGHFDDEGYFVEDSKTESVLEDSAVSTGVGTFYRLRITNNSDAKLYLTVLGLSNDGAINAMYPNDVQEPLIRNKSIVTGLYVTSRPFGTERIKIIATREYSDYRALSQGAVSRDPQTSQNPLTRLLEQAVFGSRKKKRGETNLSPDVGDWGVSEISLDIRPN